MKDKKIEEIAYKIYEMGRSKVMVNFRFMAGAITRSRIIKYPYTVATDGSVIFYNPVFVVKNYKQTVNYMPRAIMHMAVHCVFTHMFVGEGVDRRLWDLACDIVTESTLNELGVGEIWEGARKKQETIIQKAKDDLKQFTAEYVYKYLKIMEPSEKYLDAMERLFAVDEHSVWYDFEGEKFKHEQSYEDGEYVVSATEQKDEQNPSDNKSDENEKGSQKIDEGSKSKDKSRSKGAKPDDKKSEDGKGSHQDEKKAQDNQGDEGENGRKNEKDGNTDEQNNDGQNGKGKKSRSGKRDSSDNGQDSDGKENETDGGESENDSDGSGNGGNESEENGAGVGQKIINVEVLRREREGLKQEWKRVALQIKVDMETFSSGGASGALMSQNLRAVTREQYSYEEFLRKFAVSHEIMKVNDDEFDYLFYTYGLKLYKNVPLVEPLEYKEEKRIKEFAIIIDTSGSVKGELVQAFLQKTYNVLMEENSFTQKVNIHIIQCDDTVRSDVKIESKEDLEKYFASQKLTGFCGTDFRPALSYVESLVKSKELTHLKGVLYFTDGWGEFPKEPTSFKTAFVFVDGFDNNEKIPPWIIRLTLSSYDLIVD